MLILVTTSVVITEPDVDKAVCTLLAHLEKTAQDNPTGLITVDKVCFGDHVESMEDVTKEMQVLCKFNQHLN